MIVRCPNCGTEFGFDDKQVGDGVTVKCSVCKHVFKVESPTAPQVPGWQIQTPDGMSFMAPDVATMRQWIREGRLTPEDKVSRTGRNWVELGSMPEFASLFTNYEAKPVAKPVAKPSPPPPKRPAIPPATGAPSQQRTMPPIPQPPASQQPAPGALVPGADIPSSRLTVSPPRSAPAQSPAPVSEPEPEPEVDEFAVLEADEDEAARSWGGELGIIHDSDPGDAAPRVATSRRESSGARPSPERGGHAGAGDELEAFAPGAAKKGPGVGLLLVGVVVVAAAVVFGVPQLRSQVLGALGIGGPGEDGAAEVVEAPELAAAAAARASLGTAAMAQAEADLQRAIDAGSANEATRAALEVALADLLVSRALAYEIAAAIDADQREQFRRLAAEDQEDSERIVDGLEGAADVERLAEVRALTRLAAGRPEPEVLPMVPEGAEQTKLVVRAAVLWRDLDAPVPSGLVAGLQGLPTRDALGDSVLALALLRAGDEVAADNVAERLLAEASDQTVAQVLRAQIGAPGAAGEAGESETGETGGETEGETGAGEEGEEGEVSKAPPPPGDEGGGGGGGGGGDRFDRLLERGCQEVSSGKANKGVQTLLKAFDIKPNDVDVLVCLAEGYAAQGSNRRAVEFYDRALKQSPSNKIALRGAAKIAAKTGAKQRATGLYQRLLKVDPNNAAAKAYLADKGGGGGDEGGGASQDEPKPEGGPQAPPDSPPADGGG